MTAINSLAYTNLIMGGYNRTANPYAITSFGYIPIVQPSIGRNVNQYFGTIPTPNFGGGFPNIGAYLLALVSSIKLPQINFVAPKVATPSTNATTTAPTTTLAPPINKKTERSNAVTQKNKKPVEKTTKKQTTQTKVVDKSNKKTKIKPGLLKGNLKGKEAVITRLCDKYNLSVGLVLTIIGLESGWGTSNLASHNNFGGYRDKGDLGKDANGHGYFSTPEKGLDKVISNLANYTRYNNVSSVDFANLDSIGKHYSENPKWAEKIRDIYNTTTKRYLY